MTTVPLASSASDPARPASATPSSPGTPSPGPLHAHSGARACASPPTPDLRAFDFSFAFNCSLYSDRRLQLHVTSQECDSLPERTEDVLTSAFHVTQTVVPESASPTFAKGTSTCPHPIGEPSSEPTASKLSSARIRPSQTAKSSPVNGAGQQGGTLAAARGNLESTVAMARSTKEDVVSPSVACHGEAKGQGGNESKEADVATELAAKDGLESPEGEMAAQGDNVTSATDVTSATKVIELHVISAVLVSQSDFFRSLFSPEWSAMGREEGAWKVPPVILRISHDEEKPFLDLLRFIYSGRLFIEGEGEEDPHAVLQLLLLANKYGVMSCVDVCAHHLREVPLSLDMCCVLLRVCAGVVLSEAASYLVASSAAFLVSRFGNLDMSWRSPEFLDLPMEALEAILGSDDLAAMSEETVFTSLLHWVRHQAPDDLAQRKELLARLAGKVRFPAMDTDVLRRVVMAAPEAEVEAIKTLVEDALWFKCSSFERQQHLVLSSVGQHKRYVRRRQLSIDSEVLLQDCYMLQPGQAILLSGGAWVCGKLFSLKAMRVSVPVGGSDFGLFLQASQRSPTHDKVLDESVTVEFSFKVKEWPLGLFIQQKQSASHTFKGLFRERGYRSLLSPWSEVMRDNGKYFRNGVMHIRADLRVLQPMGEGLQPFE